MGSLVARLLKIPLLFDYQGSMVSEMVDHNFLKERGLLFKLFKSLEKRLDDASDLIMPSSSGAIEALTTLFQIDPQKVCPVPDGVDTEIFRPAPRKKDLLKKWSIPANRTILVYLGLLNEYQGVDLLLRSARYIVNRLPDTHFIIMGYPDVKKYERMAGELNIRDNVTFTGRIDYSEAPDYLNLGDIAVSPKLSKTEANGKIYNYMAAGLPTLCFDTPVNKEILGETGVYAAFGDEESWADKLQSLLTDEKKRAELSCAVRERAVNELSWEKRGEKILHLYNDLLKKRSSFSVQG